MVLIILKGNPISTNNCYYHAGRGLTFIKPKAKALKESYAVQVRQQYKGKPMTGDVEIAIKIYFDNKRKNDWDNFHKLSQDVLNKTVIEDDSQIIKATVEKFYDKQNPRIEIKLNAKSTENTNTPR